MNTVPREVVKIQRPRFVVWTKTETRRVGKGGRDWLIDCVEKTKARVLEAGLGEVR